MSRLTLDQANVVIAVTLVEGAALGLGISCRKAAVGVRGDNDELCALAGLKAAGLLAQA